MAKIIDFADTQEREWIEWQQLIREKLSAEGIEEAVTTHALPRIKDHWIAVFEPLDLELPKRAVPGTLTKEQARAIQGIIDAGAELVVRRLQQERRLSFERLVQAEVALSRQALQIKPPF